MVTLTPFFTASLAVQIHISAALISLALIPPVLWRVRRDGWHKKFGYVWFTSMGVTAVSSFWISGIGMFGRFSPLHLLSIMSLITMALAIYWAVKRNIHAHSRALRNLSTFGLGIPSVLNFLPGRTFSNAFFVNAPMRGLALSAVVMGAILLCRSGALASILRHFKAIFDKAPA
ncbi:DUF2306 domain-containing protein [Pacificibacter sp. AS14]|uniref:DUF2306 domain-containing protein n=1 Tax=Pacificibacter sp. AS14 TaxID=3135785 RepID=UPI003176F9D5